MNQKNKASVSAYILNNKSYAEPSVFQPGNLLRESGRQNGIPLGKVPRICILDPDGNLPDYLKKMTGLVWVKLGIKFTKMLTG